MDPSIVLLLRIWHMRTSGGAAPRGGISHRALLAPAVRTDLFDLSVPIAPEEHISRCSLREMQRLITIDVARQIDARREKGPAISDQGGSRARLSRA